MLPNAIEFQGVVEAMNLNSNKSEPPIDCSKFNGVLQTLEDLETMYKMFTMLFIYNPMTLLGLLNDMNASGFGEDAVIETAPNEPFDLGRIAEFVKSKESSESILMNLRIAIQQFALITVYENGVKLINKSKKREETKNASWFRLMTAFRNAIVHSANLTDRRNQLFRPGENVLSWNEISISKDQLNHPMTMGMVQDGAIWKLIWKMRDEVNSLC